MKRFLLISLAVLLVGCGKPSAPTRSPEPTIELSEVESAELESLSNGFFEMLKEGDYEGCVSTFTEQMKKALDAKKLKDAWLSTIKDCGDFVLTEKIETNKSTVVLYNAFTKKGVTVKVTFDVEKNVSGLWFNYYEASTSFDKPEGDKGAVVEKPSSIEETAIVVGEGTDWPLNGMLTRQNGKQSKKAVVLVHGSGGSDMDEGVFAYKPFRDIAWGLSQKGIDVLRYDKRTFAYAEKISTSSELLTFTVKEETIDDAIMAGKMLRDMGYQEVYLLGHSLGGMLALRIQQESALFDGLIIMAGSPRTLIDIIIDQNENSIATITDADILKQSKEIIAAEKQKLDELDTLKLKDTVFGMPTAYVKDLLSVDTVELAKESELPILVMQGTEDFQVFADKDFVLWKEALKGNNKAVFKEYIGLNHCFVLPPEGIPKQALGTVEEYKFPAQVEQVCIDDIAEFLLKE